MESIFICEAVRTVFVLFYLEAHFDGFWLKFARAENIKIDIFDVWGIKNYYLFY